MEPSISQANRPTLQLDPPLERRYPDVMTGDLFRDLLSGLPPKRQAHSGEVGRKVESVAQLVAPWLRGDLVVAATLHDIGYAYRVTGFHALDGAQFLASQGFSTVSCNLVVQHSASEIEAEVRGIDSRVFEEFAVEFDLEAAHSVIAWADMTTSPAGGTVTVEERLDEIQSRYGPEALVTKFIDRARPRLLAAGQSPIGSMRV